MDISEQEMSAVLTLMDMLKRKRETTKLTVPIQNRIITGKRKVEINNEVKSNRKRRCHSL
jgi:hypothetical protein